MNELNEIIALWEKHRSLGSALATLVRVSGSSYRRPGARMLITIIGGTAGALSAGCIEHEVALLDVHFLELPIRIEDLLKSSVLA